MSTGNGLDDASNVLVRGEQYTIVGSQLQLVEQNLALDKSSPLDISLNIRTVTQIDLAEFQKGMPIKANDLIMNNTWVGPFQPANPYKGSTHWLDTNTYREFIYTGSSWVQPQ